MDEHHDAVALFVAAFLRKEATRRHCDVEHLAPMFDDAFDLAMSCLNLGIDVGERLAYERTTVVSPATGVKSWDDEKTPTYPPGHPHASPSQRPTRKPPPIPPQKKRL